MDDLAKLASQLGENTNDDDATVVKAKPIGMGETVRIILEENEDIPPTGLFVGFNGASYMIRPGEPVNIPLGVKEILDHAIQTVSQIDPQTRRIVGHRKKHRFPYRHVGDNALAS